ncbi:uncharacterized protein L969DRAFT_92180 [Mixia osmundae IAM 14324]|uniref:RPA43 OB domain-containing protein n=1 Tax=Mixia osmundae (strain CBS 9802 / IAM 14324 / JCM 22182 / KY 12970) TaxID=764103 RepID=G7DT34_MIXOS|nr:uncharacterized protein L969DRAFT_92180 [Mixia osmundae IAM 14324]KEI42754.1 hypothetical protein L969DRAFT_92180 [Mixia osmundae IAM 14324]GAA93913.1 hypothetical protein E5Q_00559 [Mixia osmundae IAM 14324]
MVEPHQPVASTSTAHLKKKRRAERQLKPDANSSKLVDNQLTQSRWQSDERKHDVQGPAESEQSKEPRQTTTERAGRSQVSKVPPHSALHWIVASMRIPLAPVFMGDPDEGIRQWLDSYLMRYLPSLGGVLLSYELPVRHKDARAAMVPSTGFLDLQFDVDALVFRPELLTRLEGRITNSTPGHISLLVYDLFNASIARQHIDLRAYRYDPDRAVPRPREKKRKRKERNNSQDHVLFETADYEATSDSQGDAGLLRPDPTVPLEDTMHSEQGQWVHRKTNEVLGDQTGHLSFTVVGLTFANLMISIKGSLLQNPAEPPEEREHDDDENQTRAGRLHLDEDIPATELREETVSFEPAPAKAIMSREDAQINHPSDGRAGHNQLDATIADLAVPVSSKGSKKHKKKRKDLVDD